MERLERWGLTCYFSLGLNQNQLDGTFISLKLISDVVSSIEMFRYTEFSELVRSILN